MSVLGEAAYFVCVEGGGVASRPDACLCTFGHRRPLIGEIRMAPNANANARAPTHNGIGKLAWPSPAPRTPTF
eukprot:scaffold5593_cov125-Isochrysis_galbana.AAC.8